jgi:putative membrane protein
MYKVVAMSLALIAVGFVGCEDTYDTASRSDTVYDRGGNRTPDAFLNALHRGNLEEIRLADLAASKSQNEAVKEFAARMMRDHQASDQKVMQLALAKNVTLTRDVSIAPAPDAAAESPRDPARPIERVMPADREYQRLSGLSSEEFDRQYMTAMEQKHNDLLQLLMQARRDFRDEDVIGFIDEIQPVVTQHAEHAQEVSRQLRGQPIERETTD